MDAINGRLKIDYCNRLKFHPSTKLITATSLI